MQKGRGERKESHTGMRLGEKLWQKEKSLFLFLELF